MRPHGRLPMRSTWAIAAVHAAILAAPAPAGAEPRRDSYRYDDAGRLVGVVQGDGGEIRYGRDPAGNVVLRDAIAALRGDESGDGRVSVVDAVTVVRIIEAGGGTPRADCDRDGTIAPADVDCITSAALAAPPG